MSEERILEELGPVKQHIRALEYHIADPELRILLADAGVKRLRGAPVWALKNVYLFILPRFTRVHPDPVSGKVGLKIDVDRINKAIEEERKKDNEEYKFYVKASEAIKPRATDYLLFSLYEELFKTELTMTPGVRYVNLRLLNQLSPPNINLTARFGEEGRSGEPYEWGRMEIRGSSEQEFQILEKEQESKGKKISYQELWRRMRK